MKEVTKTISVFEAEDGTCFEKKENGLQLHYYLEQLIKSGQITGNEEFGFWDYSGVSTRQNI